MIPRTPRTQTLSALPAAAAAVFCCCSLALPQRAPERDAASLRPRELQGFGPNRGRETVVVDDRFGEPRDSGRGRLPEGPEASPEAESVTLEMRSDAPLGDRDNPESGNGLSPIAGAGSLR